MAPIAQTLASDARPRILLAVASQIEARAIRQTLGLAEPNAIAPAVGDVPWSAEPLGGCVDMVVTGVGKVNAAAAVAATLAPAHAGVISLGIAGILPGAGLSLGDVVVASAMRYPDEGKLTTEGYLPLSRMGFAHGPFDEGFGLAATPAWATTLRDGLESRLCAGADRATVAHAPRILRGAIATVSTCSATDALARQVVERTGAIAEGMEGAAACQVAAWHARAMGEVRVLSNTTGSVQQWDMRGSLAMLGRVASALVL